MASEQWKSESIDQFKRSSIQTLDLLETLSLEQLNHAETQGVWSIRDILGHIISWEEEACKRLQQIREGMAPQIYYFKDAEDVDRWNAQKVPAFRDWNWDDLLKHYRKICDQLLSEIQNLDEAEIDNPAHTTPVSRWLPQFAWGHEEEHREKIKKWMQKM